MKEKRKSKRLDILEHFSFFVSIPKFGTTKLHVNDISELGVGFVIDTLGEFKMKKDEKVDLNFYLNQTLFIPLKIQVMRVIDADSTQDIGAVFLETGSNEHKTFLTLVKFVDELSEVAKSTK